MTETKNITAIVQKAIDSHPDTPKVRKTIETMKRNLKMGDKVDFKNPRGYQKVHTVACYNDTWRKFNGWKHQHKLTGDQSLNALVDHYRRDYHRSKLEAYEEIVDGARKKIKALKKEI